MTVGLEIVRTLGWALFAVAAFGTIYMVAAAVVVRRFFARSPDPVRDERGVSILKPLHGAEPRLASNLRSFLDQDHPGPIQLICGVQSHEDGAIATVREIEVAAPRRSVELVVDAARHGANAKVSNLINLEPHVRHDRVVLSDSDIAVRADYLAAILGALDEPGTGAVTCLYHGRGDAGFWSSLAAAGVSYQWLPGATFAVAFGLARPCMGSTIALRAETLRRIGGFMPFADRLADDYEIGEAVHRLGLRVSVPPLLVAHASCERGFADLWRHELRWAATLRGIAPASYAASVISMPLPLAVAGALLTDAWGSGAVLIAGAAAARLLVVRAVDRAAGTRTASPWLLPLRDFLSIGVFVASYFGGSVDWRGQRLKLGRGGEIRNAPGKAG